MPQTNQLTGTRICQRVFILLIFTIVLTCFLVISSVPKNMKRLVVGGNYHYPTENSIYVLIQSNLGNEVSMYAALYGIARMTGRNPVYVEHEWNHERLARVFRKLSIPKHKRLPSHYVQVKEKGFRTETFHGEMISAINDINSSVPIVICCFLESYKYFAGFEDELRNEFQLNFLSWSYEQLYHIKDILEGKFGKTIPSDKVTYIGVHVRRGDKLNDDVQRSGWLVPDYDYLEKAMEYYNTRYQNIIYVVTSDHTSWCKEKLGHLQNVYINTWHHTAEEDFSLLCTCNHTIMTIGTFGWWAGWIAGGEVVYYRDYARPGSSADHMVTLHDHFPPSWIGIGSQNGSTIFL